jgi:predicted dehydrogenase
MSEPIRIGIVGAGAIAQLAHLPVLAKMRGVQLTAICDNDFPKARALAQRFGVADAHEDIDELLDSSAPDLVVVTTPNHLHEAHVLRLLAAKTNVFCERPLALTPKGVEKILAASKKSGAKVFVGNNHRFRTDVQLLSSFLKSGEMGRLWGIRSGAYHPRGAMAGWRANRPEAGGGAFLEHGWALLDLAMWMSGFPAITRVHAHMDRPRGAKAVENAMLVVLGAADGTSFTFDVTWSYVGTDERWWFETLAEHGSARLNPLRVVKELNGRAVDVSPTGGATRESAFLQSYRAQHAHVHAVLSGETPYKAPDDQLKVAQVLTAIYESAEDGKERTLKDA